MVCCEVKKESKNIQYMIRTIPAGKYAKFVVKGNVQTAVIEAWKNIWHMDLPRSFNCDFEEYLNDDMELSLIHIYTMCFPSFEKKSANILFRSLGSDGGPIIRFIGWR